MKVGKVVFKTRKHPATEAYDGERKREKVGKPIGLLQRRSMEDLWRRSFGNGKDTTGLQTVHAAKRIGHLGILGDATAAQAPPR